MTLFYGKLDFHQGVCGKLILLPPANMLSLVRKTVRMNLKTKMQFMWPMMENTSGPMSLMNHLLEPLSAMK
ncbi:hypothetical protein C490_03108 [Natronobacterium gregoryi SP2]|uniref:Uncharacterized protein n=1 Tax=Natronobacterium gregoryi (strain ATCC 43098 / DSM 3393 / CCM 3738 / CIP 104747 / IAM 13177 / JCM 8860 / NBRC 102187 / NCIMB 2189 / SP2) TaxID=797304 RepID=L9YEK7_NATGS|nr:hypothetical protein C490_03108 [Natronobacterium gregoryi SP2]